MSGLLGEAGQAHVGGCGAGSVERESDEFSSYEESRLKAMYAFALGAASCGTSVESSLENKTDMAKDRSSHLSTACSMVEKVCLGDEDELRRLMHLLDHSSPVDDLGDGGTSSGSGRRAVVTCFLALEHSSRQLIIGRKDAIMPFPLVVAVPCYDALLAALEDWEGVIAMNNEQLTRTRNYEETKTWSNEDKGAWWTDRDRLDERIHEYMCNIQALLGVWRCLLAPTSSLSCLFPAAVESDVRGLVRSLLEKADCGAVKAKPGNKSGRNKPAVRIKHDEEMDENAKVTVLMHWIQFIAECETLTPEEQFGGVLQLLQSFVHSRGESAGIDEDDIKTVATDIWEVTSAFKDGNSDSAGQDVPSAGGDDNVSMEVDIAMYDEESDRSRLEGLKVPELKKLLKEQNQPLTGKKSDLVNRMCEYYSKQHLASQPTAQSSSSSSCSSSSSSSPGQNSSCHLVLILDELLQTLPFESMSMLHRKEVSRVPGLTVLMNLLLLHTQSRSITSNTASMKKETPRPANKLLSLAHCWYSIDPDANLLGTRSTMMHFMQPYATKWGWTGFVGEKPPSASIK
jgi:hypothetical protein